MFSVFSNFSLHFTQKINGKIVKNIRQISKNIFHNKFVTLLMNLEGTKKANSNTYLVLQHLKSDAFLKEHNITTSRDNKKFERR